TAPPGRGTPPHGRTAAADTRRPTRQRSAAPARPTAAPGPASRPAGARRTRPTPQPARSRTTPRTVTRTRPRLLRRRRGVRREDRRRRRADEPRLLDPCVDLPDPRPQHAEVLEP